ncbi:MAG: phosphoribosylamine--glycine ligase [Bauldia sp.]
MKVLLIGGGGREHALAWKLRQSPRLTELYAAPGNPGIAKHASCVSLDPADSGAVIAFCRSKAIDLVVVGPEAPLVDGVVDRLGEAGIAAFGPSAAAARLEGSKGFTKDLAAEARIPTAAYRRCRDLETTRAEILARHPPIVVKADGLAAGKGVTIAATHDEAIAAAAACFSGAFGHAGAEVVIEDYLAGEEVSFFAISDGVTVLPLASARDYKRLGDGDEGPNTGGMGAISPAPAMTPELAERAMREIVGPTVTALRRRGTPFRGILYAGLMITAEGPKLIEYNVRFGDPECQVLMMRLESDLLEVVLAAVQSRLETLRVEWSGSAAATVVMAAPGYPSTPVVGSEIRRLDEAEQAAGVKIFHAGTRSAGGRLLASGGRVLCVTARGETMSAATAKAYRGVALVDWPEGIFRSDIGEGR